MKRLLLKIAGGLLLALFLGYAPVSAVAYVGGCFLIVAVLRWLDLLTDLILGCEEPSDRSDSRPMTANIPAESAKALGLTAPGDEAYIEVTEVNSDGSVVVTAEMEDAEDSAPPPPAPAPAAMPEELGKMLGS